VTRSRRQRLETVAFAVLATLAVASLGLFVALLAGVVPVSEPVGASEEAPPPAATAPAPATTATAARTVPPPSPPAPPRQAAVTIVAARGDCWIVARRGGPEGEVLHEALVPAGERVTVRAPRVWLQLGAAANVDVVVDGDRVSTGAGTVELVLPPAAATAG
jgi:hypothetical protein